MAIVLSVINQKGGVGKSTTAFTLGAGLIHKGCSVLFIDMDSQGSLTSTIGASLQETSILSVLMRESSCTEAIQVIDKGDISFSLLPSNPLLISADVLLVQVGKEYRLREALQSIMNMYDYIVIDTPPALSILTINALTASNGVVIPVQADVYSLQGVMQLYDTIRPIWEYCNPFLKILGILLTRYNARTVLTKNMVGKVQEIADYIGTKVYTTRIRECIVIKESQACSQDIFSYAPSSNASKDYATFIDELIIQCNDIR